ncbi:MAG TPA: ATP-binding protein [Bacteroidales bacterium]|nr:ATP-binding protein [Bacteroidales bacterium]HPD23397.1 ATP-binding protein [Bacteroidales bacterium]HRS99435.1 ATP-binding protein [Bacteroidales bacterium]
MSLKYFFIIVQNASLLITFALLYNYLWIKNPKKNNLVFRIISGVIIGFVTLLIMSFPAIFFKGIIFDTRSVILAISGLFFGFIPTLIATLLALAYRIYLGGDGIYMGIAVILTSPLIGLYWHYFRKQWKTKKFILELLKLAFIVHIFMFGYTSLLPKDKIFITVESLWINLLFVYIPATVFLGWFMLNQELAFKNIQADKKLIETQKRFITILQKLKLSAVILNKNQEIYFLNKTFIETLNQNEEDLMGKKFYELFYDTNNKPLSELRLKDYFILPNFETIFKSKDINDIHLYWTVVQLYDLNKEIEGYALIGENITERLHYEKDLHLAIAKAEESDRLKTAFLSNISHEIRTPLNSIIGFADLLIEKEDDDEKREFLTIIKYSSNKLLDIVNDIIDISRLETGQMKINREYFDIWVFISFVFKIYESDKVLLSKNNLKINLDLPDYLKGQKLYSDKTRIQQILNNLVNNAIKYTDKGEIDLSVELSRINGTDMLVFKVKDTGRGIPDNMLNVIFERFRQVEENDYRIGTGLGLSICKGIVELLGGQIWVESKVDVGSSFYFSIPFVQMGENDTNYNKNDVDEDLKVFNKTIIIAEDDQNSFYYLNKLLSRNHLKIYRATNGKEVLELIKNQKIDLILMDISMPEMSGIECTKIIRQTDKEVKIIAQTAYASLNDRDRTIETGCDEFISKPINKIELYKKINAVFQN